MNRLRESVSALLNLPAIAELGSILKAAEHLNISQPALTRKLSRLEEILEVPLLMRTPKGVSLTPFGETVVTSARIIEAELLCTIRAAQALKANASGSFRVGVSPLPSPYAISPAIEALHSQYPKLSVKIVGGLRSNHRARLLSGEIDLVVASCPFGRSEDGFLHEPLFDFELRVIANAKHPLASKSNITVWDLFKHQWILPAKDSGLYKRFQEEFRRAGGRIPECSMEIAGANEDTKALLMTSELLAILPVEAVEDEIKQGQLVSLNGSWNFGHQTIAAFMREQSSRTSVMLTFLEQLKHYGSTKKRRADIQEPVA
jgi:DNA-binding transcriptional LysR family regulator